jgi:hypothetical protein
MSNLDEVSFRVVCRQLVNYPEGLGDINGDLRDPTSGTGEYSRR